MFAQRNNKAVCLEDYGTAKQGYEIPKTNKMYSVVEDWLKDNDWADFPAEPVLKGKREIQRGALQAARDSETRASINGFQVSRTEDRENIKDAVTNWDLVGVESIDWVLEDNTTKPVNKSDLEAIVQEYATRKLNAFNKYNQLNASLLDSTDPESITWNGSK